MTNRTNRARLLLALVGAAAAFLGRPASAAACAINADCSPPTPLCNTATGVCMPCQGDYGGDAGVPLLDCPDPLNPACQGPDAGAVAGQCTQCSASNGSLCAGATPICNVPLGACGCVMDGDCANPQKICLHMPPTSPGTCIVGCRLLSMGDSCVASGTYCDVPDGGTTGTCQPGCKFNAECVSATTPVCDKSVHQCVQCVQNSDCVGGAVCDTMSDTNHDLCVECLVGQTHNCFMNPNGAACLDTDACGCMTDADCGNTSSGQVCDMQLTRRCESGCRGSGGNGCLKGQVCSSTNMAIGMCQNAPVDGGTGSPDAGAPVDAGGGNGEGGAVPGPAQGGGCGCTLWQAENAPAALSVLGLLIAGGFWRRRHRR